MDKDRVKGSAKKGTGKAKELAGRATGSQKLRAKGKVQKTGGEAQNIFGKTKDAIRDTFKR